MKIKTQQVNDSAAIYLGQKTVTQQATISKLNAEIVHLKRLNRELRQKIFVQESPARYPFGNHIPIEHTDISVRLKRILLQNKINTVNKLLDFSVAGLKRLNGIGEKSIWEAFKIYEFYGKDMTHD